MTLTLTQEQFDALDEVLRPMGVEIRIVVRGKEGIKPEFRNVYRDNCCLFSHLTGLQIQRKSIVEAEEGRWSRT